MNTEEKEELKEEDQKKTEEFAGQVQSAIDLIWDEHDADGSGFLDKKETEEFIKETLKYLDPDAAQNYNRDNFDAEFKKWDADGNGVV